MTAAFALPAGDDLQGVDVETQRRGWWPDERLRAGEEHLDPDYVATYDRKAQTDPAEDVALLRSHGLDESSTVVDIGAGTGTFAVAVAPYCRRVVAVDVSPAMLRVLKGSAQRGGHRNIEVVNAGWLNYEHVGTPADFVFSRNVLHHLPDFWKAIALRRTAEMLRPDGIFRLHDLVFSCEIDEVESIVEEWLSGAAKTPELGWTSEEFETHLRQEYSTYTWLLEPMLERAGFEILEATNRMRLPYAAYTCVKRA